MEILEINFSWSKKMLIRTSIKMKNVFCINLALFSIMEHVIAFESQELELKINNFLNWKFPSRNSLKAAHCFSVSYGFENKQIEIPMLEINIDQDFVKIDRNLQASTEHCFLAFTAIEHRERLPELVLRLNNISDIIQVKPTAIFVFGDEKNNEITWGQQTILTVSQTLTVLIKTSTGLNIFWALDSILENI